MIRLGPPSCARDQDIDVSVVAGISRRDRRSLWDFRVCR